MEVTPTNMSESNESSKSALDSESTDAAIVSNGNNDEEMLEEVPAKAPAEQVPETEAVEVQEKKAEEGAEHPDAEDMAVDNSNEKEAQVLDSEPAEETSKEIQGKQLENNAVEEEGKDPQDTPDEEITEQQHEKLPSLNIEAVYNDDNETPEATPGTFADPLDPERPTIDPMEEEEDSNSAAGDGEVANVDELQSDEGKKEEKGAEHGDKNDIVAEPAEQVQDDPVAMEAMTEKLFMGICTSAEKHSCYVCKKEAICKYIFTKANEEEETEKNFVCGDKCYDQLKEHCVDLDTRKCYSDKRVPLNKRQEPVKFTRKCRQCSQVIIVRHGVCSWEAMDFCKEHCLYRYQLKLTKTCSECNKVVQYSQLGKYSVRFGSIIRQFCSGLCLDQRKKKIRICSYCQRTMQNPTDIALGMKTFCREQCKGRYVNLLTPNKPPYLPAPPGHSPARIKCYICEDATKPIALEFHDIRKYYFCGSECFTVFKFIHDLVEGRVEKCRNCFKYAQRDQLQAHQVFYEGAMQLFCSKVCKHIYVITHRKILACVWCKVKKYNFDLIVKEGLFDESVIACSLYCLNQLRAAVHHVVAKGKTCEHCGEDTAVCDISTVDGKMKSFCSNKCIGEFHKASVGKKQPKLPMVASVCSLARSQEQQREQDQNTKELIFVQDEQPADVANKMCSVKLMTCDAQTGTDTEKVDTEVQSDLDPILKVRVLPVPIYVPQPLNMWQCPVPRALPFPIPVPVPMLLPLTRDSSTDYLKSMRVQKDTVKTPADPFEAELLMMAELVAAEKPSTEEQEEMQEADTDADAPPYSPEPADGSFNDDMLQMALKMASDYHHEAAVDLEGALTANTITPGHHQSIELTSSEDIIHTEPLTGSSRAVGSRGRGRGRGSRGSRGGVGSRRGRGRPPAMPPQIIPQPEPAPPPPPPEPVEKPDANMCLKYTFGVNAWKQWVTTKNADLERSSRKLKLFNTDLMQMTADELNYSMCLFVNEVRKPNGAEYAPDTIYYLCLGIQQFLYENGRIDNIFCDSYYEKFTDCLDDVCSKFSSLYNDSHYIVTRVEEEHLWESKQLGAHSPFVLLSTLMFFNTKHFNLTTIEEHMQLSFSHIMKHWKRNPHAGRGGATGGTAGRNVLLRFYPPQNAQANSRKKKVYEQQENEVNPLRCPVKLYEFYLSKCPESVKTRNDVFYLLPERSCVPESPVWYSTMALDMRALRKMLHRVKMVKEINVALLTH